MANEGELQIDGKTVAFIGQPLAQTHKFYVCGEIGDAVDYVEWFEIIRNAGENDVVYLYINSPGGKLWTAIQMMRAMAECKGTLVASVEGMCMSAATLIFLAAKHYEISNHSMFMFHNYSNIAVGKGGEIHDQVLHEREWSQRMFTDQYKDFLTDQEIKSVLDNKDIWLTGDEVVQRLQTRMEKRNKPVKVPVKKRPAKTSKPRKSK